MMQLQGKKKFKAGVQWLVWSGILAAVSAGGWLIYAQTFDRSDKSVSVRLLAVERGNVEVVINESGMVELGGQQPIKFPGEVTVDRVLVKVGDPVRLGQKLLMLRNPEGQANLANQELEIKKQELYSAVLRERKHRSASSRRGGSAQDKKVENQGQPAIETDAPGRKMRQAQPNLKNRYAKFCQTQSFPSSGIRALRQSP